MYTMTVLSPWLAGQKINHSKSVELWGTGTPKREFLYVDDLADACFCLLQNYDDKIFVNINKM